MIVFASGLIILAVIGRRVTGWYADKLLCVNEMYI